MELKEMIETYMMLLDNSIKNMEEDLARSNGRFIVAVENPH